MKRILLYFVLTSCYLCSCNEILFNEDEGTRTIPFGNFHAVKISGIYNLVLVQDSANRLDITGANDINSITAVIKNDTLIIDSRKKMSFNPEKNRLSLHFTDLKYIVTYDPVNVTNSDTIKADQFTYEALGEIADVGMVIDCNYLYFVNSGNTLGFFYFRGRTNGCLLWNRYGSTIFADGLSCKDAEVINASAGDVYVNASENIRATILGPGNIYYRGTPVIDLTEKRGSGKMIPLH